MAIDRVHCRFLVLAAMLCGPGPLMANDEIKSAGSTAFQEQVTESDRPWLNSTSGKEMSAGPGLHLINRTEIDLLRSFSGETQTWGQNRFSIPLQKETWRLDSTRALLINALAIEWQHSMNASNLLTLSARHGDSLYSDAVLPGSSGTAATLSWSTLFGGESRVIGRLYAGDEDTKERGNGNTDKRYFGLHVEGRYGLWRDHAPFASLTWQRSFYEMQDSAATANLPLRRDSYSLLGAGWNWRVSPSWDVRAEANYRLADDSAEDTELDRTQFLFSTRYGFR